MFTKGQSVYIKPEVTAVNIRKSPSLKAVLVVRVGSAKEPVGGKFIGKVASIQNAEGTTWVKLDYKDERWIVAGNLQNGDSKETQYKLGDSVFVAKGMTAKLYEKPFNEKGKVLLTRTSLEALGGIQSVRSAGGRIYLEVSPPGSKVNMFVESNFTITGNEIKRMIDKATAYDQKVYQGALVHQERINRMRAKGFNVNAQQTRLNTIVTRYKARQDKLESFKSTGLFTGLIRKITPEFAALRDSLKKQMGLGFPLGNPAAGIVVPITTWLLIAAGIISVTVVSFTLAKWIYTDRPDEAAKFDMDQITKDRECLKAAEGNQAKIDACTGKLKKAIDDYGKDEFEKGDDSSDGLFGDIGDNIGKVITWGGLFVVGKIIYDKAKKK